VPPYTIRLWLFTDALSGVTAGPVVPAGVEWVIRNVDIFTPGLVTEGVGGWTLELAAGAALVGFSAWELHGGAAYSWEGRQSVASGEQLQAVTAKAGFGWSVTGYQLLL
jgi:hypothetical protein